MFIEPLTFKEFDAASVPAALREKRENPFAKAKAKNDEPPTPPPPPTFSEEQLETAKREAYQKGFLDGVQDGINQAQNEQADLERKLMENIEAFAISIDPIFTSYKSHILKLRQDMPTLAIAIAKKVAGAAMNADYQEVIEKATQQCAEAMISEPSVTISINESLAAALSQKLEKLHGKVPSSAHIEVIASPLIPAGDYRIEWKNGSIERIQENIWQQMDKAIANMLAAIANEPQEQLENLTQPTPNTGVEHG